MTSPAVDQVCGNYVLHCAPMFTHAGADLARYDKAPCSEAAGPLAAAVRRMEADPDAFKALAPATQWGSDCEYEDALKFLRYLADASAGSPNAILRVELISRR